MCGLHSNPPSPLFLQATPEEATGIINAYRRTATNAAPNKAIFSNLTTSAEALSPATGAGETPGGTLEGKEVEGFGGLFVGELEIELAGEEPGVEADDKGETAGGDGGDKVGEEDSLGVGATGDGALVVGGDAVGVTVGLAFVGEVTGDVDVVGAPAAFDGRGAEVTGDVAVAVGAPAAFDGRGDGDCAQHEEAIKPAITNIITATCLLPAIVSDSNPQSPSSCLKA